MNLSSWSIRNPVPAILLFIILTAAGLFSLHKLGVQNFPDLDVPTIQVSATLEGAAPAQLETEVARKIEDKLASVTGLDHITTTITDGSAVISVSFDIDKDSEVALNEVRNAVDGARADLPTEMAAPVVSKVTRSSAALLTYTVAAPNLSESDLSWFVDNDINKALLLAKGVGAVNRVGGVEREMHVILDPALMASLGVTVNSVSSQIKAVQTDASGGRGTLGASNQSVRTLGRLDQPEQLAALAIPLTTAAATQTSVRLDQIASVSDTAEERFSYAALDGKPVVGFQVTRQVGSGSGACGSQDLQCQPSSSPDHRGDRNRTTHSGKLRRINASALRGRHSGGGGGLAVSARLAGDFCLRGGVATVHHPDLHRDVPARLFAQPDHPAEPVAGGGGAGRRCHR